MTPFWIDSELHWHTGDVLRKVMMATDLSAKTVAERSGVDPRTVRDDPQTTTTRRATATKIGQGLFEIATDVVACAAVGVTACDGSPFCTCAVCSESAVRQYLAEVGIDAQRYA